MLYAYLVESESKEHDNSGLFRKIKELEIKMNNIYIDENIRVKNGLNDCLRILKPRDFLLVRTLLDIESENAKRLEVILKELESKGVELISLEQAELSHGNTYTKLREVLSLDKHFREFLREKYFRQAVAEGKVGRPKVDNKKIKQALTMYNSGLFRVKEICETAGVSKTKLYEEIKKQRDVEDGQ